MRILGILILICLLASCSKQSSATKFDNPVAGKCPVMGEDIDSSVTYTHEGKNYAFCCKECVPKFKNDPDKYLSKKNKTDAHGEHEHENH